MLNHCKKVAWPLCVCVDSRIPISSTSTRDSLNYVQRNRSREAELPLGISCSSRCQDSWPSTEHLNGRFFWSCSATIFNFHKQTNKFFNLIERPASMNGLQFPWRLKSKFSSAEAKAHWPQFLFPSLHNVWLLLPGNLISMLCAELYYWQLNEISCFGYRQPQYHDGPFDSFCADSLPKTQVIDVLVFGESFAPLCKMFLGRLRSNHLACTFCNRCNI